MATVRRLDAHAPWLLAATWLGRARGSRYAPDLAGNLGHPHTCLRFCARAAVIAPQGQRLSEGGRPPLVPPDLDWVPPGGRGITLVV
jgi:hypothetical protein